MKLTAPKGLPERAEREAREEYQRMVDSVNRSTDAEIAAVLGRAALREGKE